MGAWIVHLRVGLWCLMPLSAIFQLYHGRQFCWWRKQMTPINKDANKLSMKGSLLQKRKMTRPFHLLVDEVNDSNKVLINYL